MLLNIRPNIRHVFKINRTNTSPKDLKKKILKINPIVTINNTCLSLALPYYFFMNENLLLKNIYLLNSDYS